MLYTVSHVSTSCISIELYQTVVNIKIEQLEKKSLLNILGVKDERIFNKSTTCNKNVISEQYWEFTSGFFLLHYQE